MNKTLLLLSCTLSLLPLSVLAEDPGLIAPGATLRELASGFGFTEGPAADAQGNVYFTDQPNDRIMKWTVDGELVEFLKPSGRSNGLYFDQQGNLWACADEKNQLWKIDPKQRHSVVIEKVEGKLLNGPNDLWIHPDGSVYFTDPLYKRKYWDRGPQELPKAVYRLSAELGSKPQRVAVDFKQPNGIIGTPDGKKLYVADIGAGKTYVYEIAADGSLENRKVFCQQGSDGMTLDEQGNLYLTGKGVTVFNQQGKQLQHINVPQRWTANVTFGGKELKTLFITASKAVYGLEMNVRGAAAD